MAGRRNMETSLNFFENDNQTPQEKASGIKIAGDGTGRSKTAGPGWWEHEDDTPSESKRQGGAKEPERVKDEPVNAQQGEGTKDEPYDQGNQAEVDTLKKSGGT